MYACEPCFLRKSVEGERELLDRLMERCGHSYRGDPFACILYLRSSLEGPGESSDHHELCLTPCGVAGARHMSVPTQPLQAGQCCRSLACLGRPKS